MIENINADIYKNILSGKKELIEGKVYNAKVVDKFKSNIFIIKISDSLFFKVRLPSYIQKYDIIKLLLLSSSPKYKFKFLKKIDNAVKYEIKSKIVKEGIKKKLYQLFKDLTENSRNLKDIIIKTNTKSIDNLDFKNLFYFLLDNEYFIPLKVEDSEAYCRIKKNKDYFIIKIDIFLNNEYYINVLIYKDKNRLIINFFSNEKELLKKLERNKEKLIKIQLKNINRSEKAGLSNNGNNNSNKNNVNNEKKLVNKSLKLNSVEVKFFYK